MNNREFQTWIETVQRRPLSAAEQRQLEDFLSRHPGEREAWDQEAALTRLLAHLPEPPLSEDFTSRVLAATSRPPRRSRPTMTIFGWLRLPRPAIGFAAAALAVALGVIGFVAHQQRSQARLASSIADFSRQIELAASATDLPAVQLLQDFEAIQRLDHPQLLVDEELLAVLQ